MAFNINDYSKMNNEYDKVFGAGAYNSGLQSARNAGALKAQANFAKQDAMKRLAAQQAAAKKAAKEATKPSFQDALNYWNDPANKTDLLQKGAYRKSQEYTNDPLKRQELKDLGFNKQDFIDAMYNASSGGQYKSQADYNAFASQLNKDTKASNKAADAKSKADPMHMGMGVQDYYDYQQTQKKQQAKQAQTDLTNEKNSLLGKLHLTAHTKQDNPIYKAFSGATPNQDPAVQRANDVLLSMHNDQIQRDVAKQGVGSFGQELKRGIARGANELSLGLLGQLDKNLHGGEISPALANRKGASGWIDKGSDLAGSALPFIASDGLLGGAKGLAALGKKGIAGKVGELALRGAGSGAIVNAGQQGIRYGFNPQDFNAQNAAKELALNAGVGAVANPLLHGAGQLLGKALGKGATQAPPTQELLGLPAPQLRLNEPQLQLPKPLTNRVPDIPNKSVQINGTPLLSAPREMLQADKLKIEYKKEFQDAVKQQYNYLKSSMGKGVDYGTTGHGLGNLREVTGSFSVSRNPKWYQDFYKTYGRKPNNGELMQLAEEHVKHGFADETGNLPPYSPKNVQEIDNQINQIQSMLKDAPEQGPQLNPILSALHEDRAKVIGDFNQAVGINPSVGKADPVLPSAPVSNEPPLSFKTQKAFNMKDNFPLNFTGKINPKDVTALKSVPKGLEDISKPGKGYTNISAAPKGKTPGMLPPSELDNHGYGLFDTQAKAQKPNPFDAPYKPGDPLPDTSGHIGTKTEKSPLNIKAAVDKGYIKTVDNLHRLSQFDKQVEQTLGKDLKPSESTHMLGLNSRGSDMISKQILTQNMVNKNGEAVGNSLKDITMKVPKGKLKNFEDYLVNKHAITRMDRGEKVFPDKMNMTTGKSKEIVKNYEANNPEFKDLAKQYYDYNKQLGQHWLVDTGVLSKDQWEGYLKENPHYVPNNRIFSDLEMPKFGNSAKKGFANQANPVKKAIGSQRQIVSPIESTIEHTAQYVKTAKRNEVMQTLINNIKQNPEAFKDWAEIVPTDKTPQSVMETLKKEGVDGVLGELNKGFDQKPDLSKGNIVSGIIDGQKVHVKVNDPQLLDAITNLQPKAQNIVIHSVGQVTRVMKNLTTGINPVFSLTRNIFRDIPTAYTNSKSTNNPITFSKDLVQSVVSVMKNDKLYKSFKAVGGGHASPTSSTVNLLSQSKRSILPREKGLLNGAKHFGGKALGALENFNNTIESAPRLGEFKRLNGDTYDSKMKALYEANDVTVNFNKYGNASKEIDSVVPYFNAAIQGLDKTRRVFFSSSATKSEKAAAGVKAFMGITVPSIIMFAINHGNPDYQKVSNYIKDTNILIPKGDGTFIKIPKPRELGMIFGSDVERVLRSWVDQDPKAFQDFATNVKGAFLPPTRTTLAPFSDIRANKNFVGAPIVPADLQGLSPRYQYDAQTSEPAKKIGDILNVSPKQIDYLTKSYGGILGELGIPATTKNTTIGQTLKQKVTVDPVFSNDIMRNFYDQKTQLDQAHTDLSKQGINNPNSNEALRKMMNTQATQIAKVRKQTKVVQNDSSLTPAQRLAQLRQLQEMMNQIASQNVR